MTGDCHVRFCEGLRLKCWGLLSNPPRTRDGGPFRSGLGATTAVYSQYTREE